jgi:hypothetical protein
MTPDRAMELFARLAAAFPADDLQRPTVLLWLDRIAQEDRAVGAAAISEVIETWRSPRFPTIAVFAQAVADRRAAFAERGRRHQPELEEPKADRAELLARVAVMRAGLATATPPVPKANPGPVPHVDRDLIATSDALIDLIDDLAPPRDSDETEDRSC